MITTNIPKKEEAPQRQQAAVSQPKRNKTALWAVVAVIAIALVIVGVNQLSGGSSSEPQTEVEDSSAVSSNNFNRQRILQELADNMVHVQGGTFTMGATGEQGSDAEDDEKPAHSVTLSSYYIGKTEVTQELWEAVMDSNPSYFKGDRKPVEEVSWEDCQTFISKLNSLTGKNYRLPTEAEWEFAARGGIKSKGYKYSGSNTLGDVAWYDGNSGRTTHEVGTKSPNELGLYDMSGNVWEWCNDWYNSQYYRNSPSNHPTGPGSGTVRVARGGCWLSIANLCRSSGRDCGTPDIRFYNLGMRLCLSE